MILDRERIREFDDISIKRNGSLSKLSDVVSKAKIADDYYLFVGLGGLGMETLAKLKSQMQRTFEIPKDRELPENIRLLAIDSDRHEIHAYSCGRDDKDLNEFTETFNLYENNMRIEFVLRNFPSEIIEWMDKDLCNHYIPTNEGCGAFRQIGRYMFFKQYSSLKKVIADKISSLVSLKRPDAKLNIYIISGLGGGTGSGIIIDIAYLIHSIVQQQNIDSTLTGCLFMPDIQYANWNDQYICNNLKRNCYAALMEIDNFIDTANFSSNYGSVEVNLQRPVFDRCLLLSAANEHDGQSVKDIKSKTQQTLNNFYIAALSTTEQGMSIESFLENLGSAVKVSVEDMNGVSSHTHFKIKEYEKIYEDSTKHGDYVGLHLNFK